MSGYFPEAVIYCNPHDLEKQWGLSATLYVLIAGHMKIYISKAKP